MGKVSAGGSKGREELKALGERMGWTAPREISMREIKAMSADQVLWEETFNTEAFKAAFERDAIAKHNGEAMAAWDVRKAWSVGVTDEQAEKARIAGDQFAMRFPHFERSLANAELMVAYLRDHDLDATKIESYVSAYRELSEQGRLAIAPTLSANDFYKTHTELHDRRTPPLIAARSAKADQTAKHFEAAMNATAKGMVVNVTDYRNEQSGYPAAPTKYSFRRLLDSLSAAEYQKRLNEDTAFAAAVDYLEKGNQ